MRPLLAALLSLVVVSPAFAEDLTLSAPKEDRVEFNISGEDWVTTKTARVTANIEAAVSANNAGTVRADMMKAVNDLAKADWRLTNFSRNLDQTGLERWSAVYEARIPESDLNGLNDTAKKLSKAGMQLTVGDVDFSPTLDETEAARAALRLKICKEATDQLNGLNATLTGRNYRIAVINFDEGMSPRPIMRHPVMMKAMIASSAAQAPEDDSAERAEKITLTAHVILASLPPVSSTPVAH